MRRSANHAQTLGVSLFPFLAVLLCTMGALIVVLIVLSRQAQAHGAPTAQAASAELQEDVETARQLLDYRIEQLRIQREKTQTDLANRRYALGQVEDHWRQLEAKLVELRRAYDEYEKVQSADLSQQQARQGELETLERQAAAAQESLDAAQRQAAGRRPAFAVVPYDGPNGTRRRPIYIECRSDAVVIQPEGVRFAVADFTGPLGPSNPLAAGVRAVREYIAGQQKDNPTPQEPYPLLLVRPDGIEAYYLARLALADWDTEFGYEMIEADWPLEFPPEDAALRDIVQMAVDDARVRQRLLAHHAPRQFSEGRSRSFRAAPGGGVVAADSPDGVAATGRGGSALGRRSGAGSFAEAGRRGSGLSGGGLAGGGDGYGSGGAGGRNSNGDVDVDELPYASGLAGGGSANGGGLTDGSGNRGGNAPDRGGEGSSPSGGSFSDEGERKSTDEQGFGRPIRSEKSTAGKSGGTGGGTAAARSAASSGSSTVGSPGTPSGSASGASGGDPSQGQVGVGTPSIDFSKPASDAQCLANARGKDWGIPEAVRHATPVGRPIRLECRGDRLVVQSSSRTRRGKREIPFDGATEQSVDELVSAVWDEVQQWGIAGQGMYWHPTLNCDVTPDGQARFADLQKLLDGSGLELKARGVTASRPLQPLAAPR